MHSAEEERVREKQQQTVVQAVISEGSRRLFPSARAAPGSDLTTISFIMINYTYYIAIRTESQGLRDRHVESAAGAPLGGGGSIASHQGSSPEGSETLESQGAET